MQCKQALLATALHPYGGKAVPLLVRLALGIHAFVVETRQDEGIAVYANFQV